ncbi:MAG: ABC transporter permease [Paludibacter sp.]|nr:ABC transporter permease [Paludibacter sp.]MDD4198912.1 ABC transporter permease [Paludibacter sp.]MDD4428467.1 ABC transporter permease [Paludibacter sp.]
MKTFHIILKSLKEQYRNYWVLLLTLCLGPFFIFVYYLITETSETRYDILIINTDNGIYEHGQQVNHGKNLHTFLTSEKQETTPAFFIFNEIKNKQEGIEKLKNKQADALIVIPESFSQVLSASKRGDSTNLTTVEFIGDLTSADYMISAVWVNEMLNEYIFKNTTVKKIVTVQETPLGLSSKISIFDMYVPGILIISVIMLMFTATIAFISEVEQKTIIRLKLSKLSAVEFLIGTSFVQLIIGIISVVLTLITAVLLGFKYEGSLFILLVVASLTSLSIISFSLIISALTKSANEVLVVGCFPMFLFMFFTGAAFPLNSKTLFTIASYPVTVPGLMTPTHAISALNKTLIMNMGFSSIMPEIFSIIALSIIYFVVGAFIFKRRHLRLT